MDRKRIIKAIRKGLTESLDNENIFRIADCILENFEPKKGVE